MKINKNKRVGKILFIVEGGKHEFSLIKKVFSDILGYKRIEKRRNKPLCYVSSIDSHSIVAVVNTKTSNIASINEVDYLDNIYAELIEQYSFDVENAAIYYIFDRDSKSNKNVNLILDLLNRLKNARENENYMMGGMLILSYPSVEAYEISNFIDNSFEMEAKIGKDLKEYINENASCVSMNKISEESIIHACNELKKYMEKNGIKYDIDCFSDANLAVFQNEEKNYTDKGTYFLLSTISYILMDLGILSE